MRLSVQHGFVLFAFAVGMVLLGSDKSPVVDWLQSHARRSAAVGRVGDGAPSDGLRITGFAVDPGRRELLVEARWGDGVFGEDAVRDVRLFASTNIASPRWTRVATVSVPEGTNSCVVVLSEADVPEGPARDVFGATFNGNGFYRLGIRGGYGGGGPVQDHAGARETPTGMGCRTTRRPDGFRSLTDSSGTIQRA